MFERELGGLTLQFQPTIQSAADKLLGVYPGKLVSIRETNSNRITGDDYRIMREFNNLRTLGIIY